MFRLLSVLCSLLLGSVALLSAADIELRLNADSYAPGDLIELHAEMRRADYGEFTLHIPKHPKLHFVSHTPEPIRYQAGEYVQRAVWRFQPVTAGEFVLSPIKASLKVGAEEAEELTLAPVSIAVQSVGALDLSDEMAALPTDATVLSVRRHFALLVVILLVVIIALVLVWWLRRSAHRVESVPVVRDVRLDDLVEKLEHEQPAIDLIERLLVSADVQLSADLREAMEAAVYAGRCDRAQLLQLIKTEEGA